jgi:hypothetical protein
MRKMAGWLALLLLAAAPWAQAQVAVPEIVPGAVRLYDAALPIVPSISVVPENPAALQWGAPSRLVGGALKGKRSEALDGDSSDYKGTFGGFRWVKERVSLAAAALDYSVDFPAATPEHHLERQLNAGAIAFSWPETLAWGFGVNHFHSKTLPGGVQAEDSSGWSSGLSWRVGEHFFMGAGYGEDKADLTVTQAPGGSTPLPPTVVQARRSTSVVGAGLRGGGRLIWHVEADRIHRKDYQDGDRVTRQPGYNLDLVVAEGIVGDWLLTYNGYVVTPLGTQSEEVHGYTAAFGYAPLHGLTLTWHFEQDTHTLNSVDLSKEQINTLALSWQF